MSLFLALFSNRLSPLLLLDGRDAGLGGTVLEKGSKGNPVAVGAGADDEIAGRNNHLLAALSLVRTGNADTSKSVVAAKAVNGFRIFIVGLLLNCHSRMVP